MQNFIGSFSPINQPKLQQHKMIFIIFHHFFFDFSFVSFVSYQVDIWLWLFAFGWLVLRFVEKRWLRLCREMNYKFFVWWNIFSDSRFVRWSFGYIYEFDEFFIFLIEKHNNIGIHIIYIIYNNTNYSY